MENGTGGGGAAAVFVKCESATAAATRAEDESDGKRGVGRLVECTQADDRRMIWLVRERPLLYARSNLPVASYHVEVNKLWREVADIMGWTVAEVRRKWSHIRNSYSRHLRNEIHGVRTGRGRHVSRWYLADELEFLRAHMATDTRPCPLSLVASFAPHFLSESPELVDAAVEVREGGRYAKAPPSNVAAGSREAEENASYFQFFRGLYEDYRGLPPPLQRRFRRQCLLYLHRLLDGDEEPRPPPLHTSDSDADADADADADVDTDASPPLAKLPRTGSRLPERVPDLC